MLSKRVLIRVVVFLCFFSCEEKNCSNTQSNFILSKNVYSSKAYQAELYRLIKESPEVDYYYEMREEIFGQDYLVVNAYGSSFCGKLCLVISEKDAVKIKIDSSKGYQGAQLIGLKFKKQASDYGWSGLVYDSIEYVVE